MLGRRQALASLQSDFYRDKFRKIVGWLLAEMVIIFILIGAIMYCIFSAAPQQYYGNTTDGKILAMPQAQRGS